MISPRIMSPLLALVLILMAACNGPAPSEPAVSSWIITNARIVDGTGTAPYPGALRVDGGLITQIGQLEPLPGELVVDAEGKVLAPGFIDTHSHAGSGLLEMPDATPATSQ